MIIDSASQPLPPRADVVVVGAGPAGIALALELEGSGLDVLVLESGGTGDAGSVDASTEGESIGLPYDVATSRTRGLGGTSAIWTGQVRPLDEIDLRPRAGVRDVGWPISRGELDPYYARAGVLAEVSGAPFDIETWRGALGDDVPIVETERLTTALFRVSAPTHFGERYRADLESAAAVVALGASVVELLATADRSGVRAVQVVTSAGHRVAVDADVVVIAAGALDATRLLLASAPRHGGLGSSSGLLGVGFMEHAHLPVASLAVGAELATLGSELLYGIGLEAENLRHLGFVTLRPEVLEAEELLAFGLKLSLGSDDPSNPRNDAVDALVRGVEGISGGVYDLSLQAEARPIPQSRVDLSRQRDGLGMPLVRLDWQVHPDDGSDYVRGLGIVASEIGRAGLGRVRPHAATAAELGGFGGGHHHLGTTRMSDDPALGVVAADLRVHDLANVYVASSSVFPSGGFANPTLTILALSLRLADHLRLGRG